MRYFLTAIICAFIFAGCDTFEGPQGPPGVADIQTEEIAINGSDFSGSGNIERASYSVDVLTEEIVSDGVVFVYTDYGTGDRWSPLPFVIPASTNVASLTFEYQAGNLTLVMWHEQSGSYASIFDNTQVKVVAVPPAAMEDLPTNVEEMPYEQARRELGL